MSSVTLHQPLDRNLFPVLIRSGRNARIGADVPDSALRLAPGIHWIPAPEAKRWQHRYTLALARAITAQSTHRSARCLTHASAALLLGLPMMSQEPDVYFQVDGAPKRVGTSLPLISVPPTGPPHPNTHEDFYCRRTMLWRRRLDLSEEDITVVGGLPVTTALRTAFDCAFDEPAHNALAIADAALRLYCRSQPNDRRAYIDAEKRARDTWHGWLQRSAHRRGIAQARAVLGAATPLADSPGESVMRWLVLTVGLPSAHVQHPIDTGAERRWVDLCWPDFGIVIEVDGRMKYSTREDAWQEKLRQDAIQAMGWRFIRVVYSEFRDLHALADKVLAAFPADVVASLTPNRDLLWPGTRLEAGLREGSMLGLRRR
ncbi:hypothetical protein [Actinomyces sp. MRS3W]|uniref:hypothetical protein n=1 Tax=Actinomyces sp. MRS3W TaxID=2800796 RepID=UPI0028FD0EB4|nr:hypothetical protein [Actinomyces sp. MRS3W]MDU0349496.1 hypothetical protein [Actinomyces sp. MRS3W]